MVLPRADWKNQTRQVLDWLVASVAAVLLVMYLYQWWRDDGVLHIALAATLFVWGVVFFTGYWQPILYLVAAVIVSAVTAVWLWEGRWERPITRASIVLNLVFVVLGIYLFTYEEPTMTPAPETE